ncbi:hypothetical protein [Actinorhabdospora filicis]|nr:hypothetical protein [Actinorhabdospora filicis]
MPGTPVPGDDPLAYLARPASIDLTLAGFVILIDGDGSHFLLDARGDGRVWTVDEETHVPGEPIGPPPPESADPAVPTPELAARFGWIAELVRGGDDADRAALAAARLSGLWSGVPGAREALDRELPALAADPHLAVYWLLHTTFLAMDADRARVLAAAGDAVLVDAWAGADLSAHRARRSILVAQHRAEDLGRAASALLAMVIDASVHPATRAAWVADGGLSAQAVAAGIAGMDPGLGATILRAHLDLREGVIPSPAAGAIVADPAAFAGDWRGLGRVLAWAYPLVGDLDALEAALEWLRGHDSHQPELLATIRAVQDHAGYDVVLGREELERAERLSAATTGALADLAAGGSAPPDGEVRALTARRVLLRLDVDPELAGSAEWAAGEVLASDAPDRAALAARALDVVDAHVRVQLIERLATEIDGPAHPVAAALLRVALSPVPEGGWGARYDHDRQVEAALEALRPHAHGEPLFSTLMAIAESHGEAHVVEHIWDELFCALDEDSTLRGLDDAQAARVAAAMIASMLGHPVDRVRYSAGHQLYRFDHPGAFGVLVAALTEYGERYASGESHPHLENLVADLYSALRNIGAHEELLERLFTERRSYWRLGNAIAAILSPRVHGRAMALLRERRDHHAAANYASALDYHAKRGPELVELLREIVTWPAPTDPLVARFFAYAVAVGTRAALQRAEYGLVREAHARRGGDPIEPDQYARGRGWTDPLDEEFRPALDDTLSGAADITRAALIQKGQDLRVKNKPWKNITDEQLGVLAGRVVARRLLTDKATGAVWFIDTDGEAHALDGHEVTAPPFVLADLPRDHGFFAEATEISERASFWTASASRYTDLIRCGERVLFAQGPAGSIESRHGLLFADEAAAIEGVAALRRCLPAQKYLETSPWYVEGRGVIAREYHRSGTHNLFVHGEPATGGGLFEGEAELIAKVDRTTLKLLRGGGVPSEVHVLERRKLPRDQTVAEWMERRSRDDERDAVWHAEACVLFAGHVSSHGFPVTVSASIGTGVPEEEIAAYERARDTTVPPLLRDFWLRAGSASWTVGAKSMRILSPADMLARGQVAFGGHATLVDVFEEDQDGEPGTVFAPDRAGDDERRFTHTDQPRHPHWECHLGWMIATRFNVRMAHAITTAAPATALLYHGMKVDPSLAWRRFKQVLPTGAKLWEVYADEGNGLLGTRYGAVGRDLRYSVKRMPPEQVAKKAAAAIAAKVGDGYTEV